MNLYFRHPHYWTIRLIFILLVQSAGQVDDHNACQVGHRPEEATPAIAEAFTGPALLQTSRSTLSIAPNRTWGIDQHTGFLDQGPDILEISLTKVLLLGFTVFLSAALLGSAWYNNFWRTPGSSFSLIRTATPLSLEGDNSQSVTGSTSAASAESQRRYRRSRSLRREDWQPDTDSSDAGDWQPLRSMGLHKLTRDIDKSVDIWTYIHDSNTSWKLFLRILGALAQVWGMLALMYWSLLTKDEELMDCFAHPHGKLVTHLCTYTQACLRGFPILAANVTLVLMMRILVQNRIYYSMLSLGYVLDFADTQIMNTMWPWFFLFSMMQGGAHLLLKMYYDPDPIVFGSYVALVRKFVVPGAIFLSFFLRYAEIENTLVPLNRLVERDYTKDNRKFAAVSQLQALNERVLAFYARHRDVVGDVWDHLDEKNEEGTPGRPPALADIFENLIDTYEEASVKFHKTKKHYEWGFFRSLWPAAVLVDTRLDWRDPETRSWLCVFAILCSGCLVVMFCSICFFIASMWRNLLLGGEIQKTQIGLSTETGLAITTLLIHVILVTFFLQRTARGMFYYDIHSSEIDISTA